MNWVQTKKKIAANFCRTVLVLDDEILVHADGTGSSLDHAEQFLKAKEEFAKKGILCDLRHIEKTADASSEAMRSSLRHADVVVVDWFLGVGSGDDPSESIAVLEEMLKIGGERFVAIHSQETADRIRACLDSRFNLSLVGSSFRGEAESADVIPVKEDEVAPVESALPLGIVPPDIFTLSPKTTSYGRQSRIHLCILHKRQPRETAEELPNAILAALEKAFPDHLHWVGLEFASRVKDMLPELVRGLPSEMDVALVFQALVQAPNELADDLAECLCLELREMLRFEPLSSASDDSVIGRLIEGIAAGHHQVTGLPGNWLTELPKLNEAQASKEWARAQKILTNKGSRNNFGTLLKASLKATSRISERAHSRYAALREHFHSVRTEGLRLHPGVVLTSNLPEGADESTREWMLCLTPACDCVGDGEHDHLFVRGHNKASNQTSQGRGVTTSIFSCGHELEIKWMVASFHTQKCGPNGVEGWKPVTLLRDPFVQKIVQCLWGQQSRIGVNTSEVQREIRGEEG